MEACFGGGKTIALGGDESGEGAFAMYHESVADEHPGAHTDPEEGGLARHGADPIPDADASLAVLVAGSPVEVPRSEDGAARRVVGISDSARRGSPGTGSWADRAAELKLEGRGVVGFHVAVQHETLGVAA